MKSHLTAQGERQHSLPPEACVFADFASFLPVAHTRRYVLQLAALSKFPSYVRVGRKGEPLFRRDEVAAWFKTTFGTLLPERVAALEKHLMISSKPARLARPRRGRV